MVRSFTYSGFKNHRGQPLINVKVKAYQVSDNTVVETQYTDSSGDVAFSALPDADDVYLEFIWGNQVQRERLGQDANWNKETGVAVSAAGIHAALVKLRLITA